MLSSCVNVLYVLFQRARCEALRVAAPQSSHQQAKASPMVVVAVAAAAAVVTP